MTEHARDILGKGGPACQTVNSELSLGADME